MEDKKPAKTEEQVASPAAPRRGRRRFLQGSLGAAPVVMTLVSRPALGYECYTPSAQLSMPSSHQHTPVQCSGGSPTYWSQPQNFDQWPPPYSAGSRGGPNGSGGGPNGPITMASAGPTKEPPKGPSDMWDKSPLFPQVMAPTELSGAGGLTPTQATLFSSVFAPSPYPPETTFLDVLQNAGTDGVAAHLVAAKLNVAMGWVPILDDGRIQDLWLEYTSRGFYEPTAGVRWYAPEIVAYLQSLETR